jgi:hypothetical protein
MELGFITLNTNNGPTIIENSAANLMKMLDMSYATV